MASIQAMREERSTLASDLKNLVEGHEGDWTAANQEDYDRKVSRVDEIDAAIKRQEKVLDMEAYRAQSAHKRAAAEGLSEDEADYKNGLRRTALAKFIQGGMSALNDDEVAEYKARIQNAQSVGTGSEGGYLTQREFASSLSEAMKAFGGIRKRATVIQTETGTAMDFPTADATSEEGEIVGENADHNDEDTTFGTLELGTFKYSSKGIAVPFELIQDSHFDIEAYVNHLLALRLGRITERHYTLGTGSGQPPGLIPSAAVGAVASSATQITFDDLLELEHSVDPIYRANGSFQFADSTLLGLKKLKDGDGRPIWLPGLGESDPNTINGYAYEVNQLIASQAANALVAAFGDVSKYIIRDVMQVMLFRFTDSNYTRKGQVGFLAMMRSGGRLVDVGGAVKTLQMAAA